jgi:pimeloyl-ACP methyl ester carboxylesterase
MRMTTDDGVHLEFDVAGSGPGLVLVHGLGGAKDDFADHVPALARDHTVVTFDHRGHGASDNPAERSAYSFARLVADTVQVAEAAGLDRFRLLGHSMGGMVARKVVLQHPARVEALVMMDTSAGPIPNYDPELMAIASDVGYERGKEALKELLDFAELLETPAYHRLLRERPGYEAFVDKKWADLSEIMWCTMNMEIARQSDDLPAMAASLKCPLLVIVGEQDTDFLPPAHAMAESIPNAQLVVVPDAGHSPQFENPAVWFDALSTFLAAVPAATRT